MIKPNKPKRPLMRYYGGKWKLADWIISFFPEHKTYVEPFGGAASVLLKKKPAKTEVYNDLNHEIVNLFKVLRNPETASTLRKQLNLTPYSRVEWQYCHELSDDPVEQARRTIVLAIMSYNSSKTQKRNRNGFRSCTSGHHRMPQDFTSSTANLEAVTHRLKEVIIENTSAHKLIKQHDRRDTLFYIDPPYLLDTRSDNKGHYKHEMLDESSHEGLAMQLLDTKGYVILSGYRSEAYMRWFENNGWTAHGHNAVTGASVKGKSNRVEVVWLNPRAAAAQRQGKLFNH